MKNGRFEFRDFRNMVIIAVALMVTMITFVVIASPSDTGDAQHYVAVDNDIWSFLKYVGLMFLGLLCYIGRDLVVQLKNLFSTAVRLDKTVSLIDSKVGGIQSDVAEINEKQKKDDERIRVLEMESRKN